MKTNFNKPKFADLPNTYAGLCGVMVPRPIHDRTGYDNALELVEAMAGFEDDFSDDQADFFAVVTDLVGPYEQSQGTGRDSNPRGPIDTLKYLLEENAMTAADLSRLLGRDRTLGAKILREERNLTVGHLRILAERFKVSPALFI